MVVRIPRLLRWPSRACFRMRGICALVLLGLLAFAAAWFFLKVRQVLSGCVDQETDGGWHCHRQALKHNSDVKPLIAHEDTAVPWLAGSGSALDNVYGMVSDKVREHGDLGDWDYARDAHNTSMSRRRCQVVFPGLYAEIDRSRLQFTAGPASRITPEDLDDIEMSDGRVRAGIMDGKLYVLSTNLSDVTRPKALAVLASLSEAISDPGPSFVPDVEFVFSVQRQVLESKLPMWVFERREGEDEKVWLMPSPGYVPAGNSPSSSGKATGREDVSANALPQLFDGLHESANSFSEADIDGVRERRQLMDMIEFLEASTPFGNKIKKLAGVWTMDDVPKTTRQKGLAWATTERSWAQYDRTRSVPTLAGIDMLNETALSSTWNDRAGKLSQMCRFQFLAHDTSFHISIADGPLLCTSVLLTTKPKWIRVYHSLMLANTNRFHLGDADHPEVKGWGGSNGAGDQNVVLVADDWGDLQYKVEGLLRYPEAAETIARNNADTFRRKYLTSAATACYWREMVRAYSSVSFKPSGWTTRDGGRSEIRTASGR